MSLRLVSDNSDGGGGAYHRDRPAPPALAASSPLHRVRPFAQPSGAASIAVLSLAVVTQAMVSLFVIDSPGWQSAQVLLAGSSSIAVCFSALALYRYQAAAKAREQAGHVYISTDRIRNEDGSLTVVARVYNNSDAPIWHVEVKPRRDGAPYKAELTQHLPDVLPSMVEEWEWRVVKEAAPREERYPELIFLDAHERRWRRTGAKLEAAA